MRCSPGASARSVPCFRASSATSPRPLRSRCAPASTCRTERPGYDPFPQRDLGWDAYAMSRAQLEFS